MPWGFDHCHHEGCSRTRKRGTVFCEQHHQEHLRRPPPAPISPVPRIPYDPNELRGQWRKILQWEELGLITSEEMLVQLYDYFVHCRVRQGAHERWEAALEILPGMVVAELLAYVKVHPPRLFAPRSIYPEVRAAQDREAPTAQKELMALLEKRAR